MAGRRWTDDEMGLAVDPRLSAAQVAEIVGKSVVSVRAIRGRINRGWVPKMDAPASHDEVDYILSNPGLTAREVAVQLNRSYAFVTNIRRQLLAKFGASFGTGPYDKIPTMRGPNRLLVAKSCVRCDVIRGGADFGKAGHAQCRFCRAELRNRVADTKNLQMLEQRVMELSRIPGCVPYRSRHYDEYTEADSRILEDEKLTVCEKAARLGRTYKATSQAMQTYGVAPKREPRREPAGIWVISPPPGWDEVMRAQREPA